jgi:hypothetical protein
MFDGLLTWFSELGSSDTIAIISAVVAFLQFAALIATLWVMRRSARQQLRAYVSGLPNWISSFDETHWPVANFSIQNLGQTPAHNLVHRSEIAALPYPLPDGFRLPPITGTAAPATVLFPNVPLKGFKNKSEAFSAEELAGIRSRSMRVYIFGEIRYQDVFRKRRRSTFCTSVNIQDDAILEKLASNSPEKFEGEVIQYEAAPIGNTST